MHATQDQLVEFLRTRCDLDEFDLEDVETLISVLSEAMSAMQIMTWLAWPDTELEGVPVELIKEGRFRAVLNRGRNLVGERSA